MARTYYEILQVTTEAAPEVIAAAYRAQMQALRKHPDLGGDEREAAQINEAYGVLSDPDARARYDATIRATGPAAGSKTASGEERRRVSRHDIDAVVAFCIDHDVLWHSARVMDYSILGMRLRSHSPLKEGERVVIVPPNLAAFAIHGIVRWSRSFHPTVFERVYEAGVEFPDQMTDIDKRLSI